MKKETRAKLRYLRISPRKVRLVIGLIRGMKVAEATGQLEFSKKQAARPVLKLLQSAVANAIHNDFAKEESLIIKTAFVDGGPVLKRWKPRAFGRAGSIKKRTSHVTIILEGDIDEKAATKAGKVQKAEEKNKKNIETEKAEITEKKNKKIEEKPKKEKNDKKVDVEVKKKETNK
ncbi:50S ribosomal protein L22 [Patescibacteria group bacterium]|nr:50S ribosomal protein L22 [Patescibacteria group bacterium]MBU1895779.1 50S ribosomal protein L22 [Patescibacteria group bacterium]